MPDGDGPIAVSVPTMPGCFSAGHARAEAIDHVQEAIKGWLAVEAEQGRAPLVETPAILADAVAQALDVIQEMREAGEIATERGYRIELATLAASSR